MLLNGVYVDVCVRDYTCHHHFFSFFTLYWCIRNRIRIRIHVRVCVCIVVGVLFTLLRWCLIDEYFEIRPKLCMKIS